MRLRGWVFWVADVARAATFYRDALGLTGEGNTFHLPDGFTLRLCAPRPTCGTRGPHGVVPALEVTDLAAAKGWLRQQERPIVFEEVVPGLARLTFLDPDGNPVDLVMPLEVETWERGQRVPEKAATSPPTLRGLFEISVYVRDVNAAMAFYRDTLGLETGLAYFAHIHLLFENAPLVLRPTWHVCRQKAPHTPALLVEGPLRCPHPVPLPAPCDLTGPACADGEHTWVVWV